MKGSVAVVILAVAISCAFVAWRVEASRNQHVNQYAILGDPSMSYTAECESIAGAAAQVFHRSSLSAQSTLTVLVLGDRTSADEPREMANYQIPTSRKAIEGGTTTARRQQHVLNDILSRCKTTPQTSISPIFLGVKQALADLRGRGCSLGSQCELWVASDLEENVEPGIKSRLANPRDTKYHLPAVLDNGGIAVIFCGLASTSGRIPGREGRGEVSLPIRNPGHDDQIRSIWTSLFKDHQALRFEPYCPSSPKPADLTRRRPILASIAST